jgi:putative peptide maturation dehydrogenase
VPHLDREVGLDADEVAALGRVGETPWRTRDEIEAAIGPASFARLLAKDLLIGDGPEHARVRDRDELVRATYWRPLSAVSHYFSRWSEAGVNEDIRLTRHRGLNEMIREFGPPPPHLTERSAPADRIALPVARPTAIDDVLARRATCRNFDADRTLSMAMLSDVMQRAFGCQAQVEIIPGAIALKKANPSGGSLHPIEAYVLVRRVDGMAPGLFHYHVGEHALEPLAPIDAARADELALQFVAAQDFFAESHVLVAIVARFRRTFWKYRNHPKAYRAIALEAGHVSQNLYIAATEADLGAYITAAINEVEIEQAFGLDPLAESPLAVCGFGPRAKVRTMPEFDPLGTVWPE